MTQISTGRLGAKALFEAGDRPTDQEFANLFDSILFLGEANPNLNGPTSMVGNFTITGNFTTTQTFIVDDFVMFGKASLEQNNDKPLSVYSPDDASYVNAVIFASGSQSDILFEGISGDVTSSIRLSDTAATVRFGTHTNKGFFEIHGQEVIHYSTGSSTTDNVIHMSGSLGIGTASPSNKLEVTGTTSVLGYFHGSFAGSQGIKVQRDSGDHVELQADAGGLGGGLKSSDALRFSTNNAQLSSPAMYIETNNRVGIGTTNPSQILHISGASNPSIMVEGDPGTGAFIRFKDDNQSWRLGKQSGDSFALYDTTGTTTPITVEKATPTSTLYLEDTGNVGIGTSSPSTRLHVSGNVSIGTQATPAITLYDKNTAGVSPDILFNNNALLAAQDDFYIAIDSDNSTATSAKFRILANAQSSSADEVFYINEAGDVSASGKYYGDGSELTGITGTQLTGFVNTPGTNRIITSNNTGNSVFGEELLTFDDDTLIQSMATGDTSGHGIKIAGQNSGQLSLRNNTSTSDGFQAHIKGVASTNFSGQSGVSGLVIEGQPPSDNLSNPAVIIRAKDTADSSATEASPILQLNNWTTEVATFNKDGNLGLGETNPTARLEISSSNSMASELDVATSRGKALIALKGNGNQELHIDHNEVTSFSGSLYLGAVGSGNDIHFRANESAFTERMTIIGSTGHVGIGTSNPQNRLHLKVNSVSVGTSHDNDIGLLIEQSGAGDAGIEFEVASGQYFSMFVDATHDDLFIRDISNSRNLMRFQSDGDVVMMGGDVGINVASPTQKLDVGGNVKATAFIGALTGNTSTATNVAYSGLTGTVPTWNQNTTGTATNATNINVAAMSTSTVSHYITFVDGATGNQKLETDSGLRYKPTGNELTATKFIGALSGNATTATTATNVAYSGLTGTVPTWNQSTTGNAATSTTTTKIKVNDYSSTTNMRILGSHQTGGSDSVYSNSGVYIEMDNKKIYATGFVGALTGNASTVTNGVYTTGNQTIGGNKTFSGIVDITNTTDSSNDSGDTGALRVEGGVSIAKKLYVGTNLDVDGTANLDAVDIDSTFNASGTSTFTGEIYAGSGVRFGSSNAYREAFYSSGRLYFQAKGVANAVYIENGDNSGQIKTTFTGQHKNKPSSDLSNFVGKAGHIVVSTGVYANIPENRSKEQIEAGNTEVLTNPQMSEALPTVEFSTQINDKKVWGVLSEWDDPNTTISEEKPMYGGLGTRVENRTDDRLVINSIGEGAIMVCNYNGNIENGDYITSSPIKGLGMKQDDDLLHNYTVAKITQNEDFSSGATTINNDDLPDELKGNSYKKKLVGCTYHCG